MSLPLEGRIKLLFRSPVFNSDGAVFQHDYFLADPLQYHCSGPRRLPPKWSEARPNPHSECVLLLDFLCCALFSCVFFSKRRMKSSI